MSPSSLTWGVVVVAGLAAAYFLLLPLVALATLRLREDIEIVPFDPVETPPPPKLAAYFRETDITLVDLGFRRLGSFVVVEAGQNVQTVVQLYVNERARDAALVSTLFYVAENGRTIRQLWYTEFLSRFSSSDVRIIQTNNTDEIGAFKPLPTDLTFRFPHIEYLATLYRLHEALVLWHGGSRPKTLRVMDEYRGDAVAYLRDAGFLEPYQEQVTIGYLRYNATARRWQPTIKGAFLITWRELWPIKPIIRGAVRRKGKLLQRELGVRLEVGCRDTAFTPSANCDSTPNNKGIQTCDG